MTITEPATLATDYLMAALAIYWARDLGAQRKLDWSRTFAALAAASFVGGTYHGFQGMMAEMVRQASWQATLVFSSLSSMFMLFAGASQFGSPEAVKIWKQAGAIKFFACFATGLFKPVFLVVLADFAVTMIAVAVLAVTKWSSKRPAARLYLAGVGLFVLGGLVQALHLSPHPAFNHNDLFHVIQIIGNLLFYLVAKKAGGRQDALHAE